MSSLYDRVASKPGGEAALAAARLRRQVLVALHQAFEESGLHTKTEIARRLNIRRSAVCQVFRGGGNLRVNTLADYLFALGFELEVKLVQAVEPRRAEIEGRAAMPVDTGWNATFSVVIMALQDPHSHLSMYQPAQPVQMIWLASAQPRNEFEAVPNSTSGKIIVGELTGE
jgi:hypothetical protein